MCVPLCKLRTQTFSERDFAEVQATDGETKWKQQTIQETTGEIIGVKMSTILIISDLHTDFHDDTGKACIAALDDADIVVVAGDLGTKHTITKALQHLCDKYPEVVFVHGNHELYMNPRIHLPYQINAVKRDNLHWLNNSAIMIHGINVIGSTLWFPETIEWQRYAGCLNDFRLIPAFTRWVFNENARAVQYLRDAVTPNSIVVTHHLPSTQSVHAQFIDDPITRFFVSPTGASIIENNNPQVWVHGHTHLSCDYIHHGSDTRVICNPYGYQPNEINPEFDYAKKIEI